MQQDRLFRPSEKLATLSADALASAEVLLGDNQATLARYLYRYNSSPASPTWRRRMPYLQSPVEHLTTGLDHAQRQCLVNEWQESADEFLSAHWLAFTRRHTSTESLACANAPVFKLYISPLGDSLRDALLLSLPILTDSPAISFKLGRDLAGMLRPDKFIAYFGSKEAMQNTANRLVVVLNGIPAQGVPFTAEIGGGGLMSWGIDPPRNENNGLSNVRMSWRSWLTVRLSQLLLSATECDLGETRPSTHALQALGNEGVDARYFIPRDNIWSASATPLRS